MRYLLDTNILVFIIRRKNDDISSEIQEIISDFSNQLHTSSICILELLQLYRIGKIQTHYESEEAMIRAIEEFFYIKILPFTPQHIRTLSKLHIDNQHNDPFDHAIIAHAVAEKMTLISSDGKFISYIEQGLEFVFNKR